MYQSDPENKQKKPSQIYTDRLPVVNILDAELYWVNSCQVESILHLIGFLICMFNTYLKTSKTLSVRKTE